MSSMPDILTRLRAIGLSEDEALELIETPDEPRLRAIGARDASLARALRAMASDRVSLRELADPVVAPDRLASLEQAVRAEAPIEPPLTLADLRVVRQPRVERELPWARIARVGGLLAAGVALAIVLPAAIQWVGTRPPRTITITPHNAPGVRTLATEENLPEPEAVFATEHADEPITITEHEQRLAAALEGPDWFLDADRAAELARAGRLAIRVRTTAPTFTQSRLEGLAGDRGLHSPAWRVFDEPDAATVARALDSLGPVPHGDWTVDPVILAADEPLVAAVPVAIAQPSRDPVRVLLADARADGPAVASLRAALSIGRAERAYFEVLPEAVEMPEAGDQSTVLWWTEPLDRWGTPRVWIPVFVDDAGE